MLDFKFLSWWNEVKVTTYKERIGFCILDKECLCPLQIHMLKFIFKDLFLIICVHVCLFPGTYT